MKPKEKNDLNLGLVYTMGVHRWISAWCGHFLFPTQVSVPLTAGIMITCFIQCSYEIPGKMQDKSNEQDEHEHGGNDTYFINMHFTPQSLTCDLLAWKENITPHNPPWGLALRA
ncbi:unnamed protein product [Caretta caretta]